jgi:Flp pilus assembly protein TadG
MTAGCRRVLGGSRGSEIAEAALVMPLMFMMLLGIYWFGRAFNIYATINHAAQMGARTAVAQTCAMCGNASPTTNQVADQVKQVLQASHVDPTQATAPAITPTGCNSNPPVCSQPSSAGEPTINVCTNVQLNTPTAGYGPPACGVLVQFQYPYQFYLPFTSLNNQLIQLSAAAQMKVEN